MKRKIIVFKIIIHITAVLLPFKLKCQSTTHLKKYSYLMVQLQNDQPTGWATCFFVKSKNKIYVVSAYHVFTDVNVFDSARMNKKWNRLVIRINKNLFYEIKMNFESLKAKSPLIAFYNRPDIFVLEVKDLNKKFYINTVESFIQLKINDRPDSVIVFGYTKTIRRQYTMKDYKKMTNTYYRGELLNFHEYLDYPKYHYFNDKINLITQPRLDEGMSGAPVFFKYQKNNKIVFGGLAFGETDDLKSGWILRHSEVIKKIYK